jgi:hypothetical protein
MIDADELLAALGGQPIPYAVAEAIRDATPLSNILTYVEVVQVYRDKLTATGSMDAALLKVAWVAYNRGLAAKS